MKTAVLSTIWKLVVAVLLVAAALGVTLSTSLLTGAPFLLLLVAITLGTWYGGRLPGLVGAGLAVLASAYLIAPPWNSPAILDYEDSLRLVIFTVAALLLTLLAAERDRAREAARVQARRQQAIAHLGQVALATHEIPALLDAATVTVARTLGVTHSYALIVRGEGQSLRLVAGQGWLPGRIGHATVPTGAGSPAGYALLNKTPIVIRDASTETRFQIPTLLAEHHIKSGVVVGIGTAGEPMGALGAFSLRSRVFSSGDVDFFQSIANLLATAMQRHRAEEQVRRSEVQHRVLFERNLAGIFRAAFNPVTAENRWLDCNDAYARLLGYESRAQLLLEPLHAQFHTEEDRRAWTQLLARGKSITNHELRLKRKDGTPVWVVLNLDVREDADGDPLVLEGTAIDITARKHAEEQVRKLARELMLLQEQDRRRIALHLFNDATQNLAALKLGLQACADEREGHHLFRASLTTWTTLLGDTLAGLGALADDLRPPALDTLGLDATVARLCERTALRSGIAIDYASTALESVPDAHAVLVYRVVQQALSNAEQHSDAAHIRVALCHEGAQVHVVVQDDGIGFDPQKQVPDLTGRRGSGLHALRERLGLLGGALDIRSGPEQGTMLTARLPIDE